MEKKYRMIETNEMGEEIFIEYPEAFIIEKFTPLIERIEISKPKLLEPLKNSEKRSAMKILKNILILFLISKNLRIR